ncbi:S-adenosyl-L-methionine-dependent methyltransferase [Auriculariales sp. MPI-PUGE-AT-0066]|nr:S-adenosyl-L-methionine-dependent methyltransferase [Auriculariales sp. MPI-PUGE-AT-0066]
MAAEGFGTGKGALYDRARPSYSTDALQAMRDRVRGTGPLNILEVGAGTGIFTRALLAHPAWKDSVGALRAVEPSDDFRSVLESSTAGTDPRVKASKGTFDATGVPDGWADLIVVAQAWHWCPDHEKAIAEFTRALKPDGVAFLIWNLEDREAASWVARLRDTIEPYEEGSPQFRLGLWRATFSVPSYQKHFDKEEELTFSRNIPATKESVIERATSKSYIAVLPEETKNSVVETVIKILEQEPKTWIEEAQGVFNYPYKTTLVVSQKKQA